MPPWGTCAGCLLVTKWKKPFSPPTMCMPIVQTTKLGTNNKDPVIY